MTVFFLSLGGSLAALCIGYMVTIAWRARNLVDKPTQVLIVLAVLTSITSAATLALVSWALFIPASTP